MTIDNTPYAAWLHAFVGSAGSVARIVGRDGTWLVERLYYERFNPQEARAAVAAMRVESNWWGAFWEAMRRPPQTHGAPA